MGGSSYPHPEAAKNRQKRVEIGETNGNGGGEWLIILTADWLGIFHQMGGMSTLCGGDVQIHINTNHQSKPHWARTAHTPQIDNSASVLPSYWTLPPLPAPTLIPVIRKSLPPPPPLSFCNSSPAVSFKLINKYEAKMILVCFFNQWPDWLIRFSFFAAPQNNFFFCFHSHKACLNMETLHFQYNTTATLTNLIFPASSSSSSIRKTTVKRIQVNPQFLRRCSLSFTNPSPIPLRNRSLLTPINYVANSTHSNHHHHESHDHHHDNYHHHHNQCHDDGEAGLSLTKSQELVLNFAKAIRWTNLANFLREHLELCCCSAALFLAAAACPYLSPKFAVKPLQHVFTLIAFPLVGVTLLLLLWIFLFSFRFKYSID